MLLLLVAFVLAGYGVFRLAKGLEPRQRIVLVVVTLAGMAYLFVRLLPLLRPAN